MKRYILFLFSVISIHAQEPWARTYKTIYNVDQMQNHGKLDTLKISRKNVLPFTQLIVSWNAHRPERGTFMFYVRVKDKATQTWDTWHKMIEWGSNIQKSHFSLGKHSTYHYARLEMENNKKGDAFQIKIVREGKKAPLSYLKGVMVTAADFTRFATEPYKERGKNLNSCFVSHVPKKSQIMLNHPRAKTLCSPTSVSMLVGALTRKKVDPLLFSNYVYDEGLNVFGNWGFNMAHAFERSHKKALFYTARLGSFSELHSLLKKNIPVGVSLRGIVPGAKQEYKHGHLLVVVGFDAKTNKVLCHDPAFDTHAEVVRSYDLHDFIVAWERSRRLTYKAEVIS